MRATPTPGQQVATTFSFLGCYTDNVDGKRTINADRDYPPVGDMMIEKCVGMCGSFALPYKYAGREAGDNCICGNTLNTGPAEANNPCTMHCSDAVGR